jgi:hypothetical protein
MSETDASNNNSITFFIRYVPCEDWSSMCNELFSFLDNVMDSSDNFKRISSVLGHDYFKHLYVQTITLVS